MIHFWLIAHRAKAGATLFQGQSIMWTDKVNYHSNIDTASIKWTTPQIPTPNRLLQSTTPNRLFPIHCSHNKPTTP